MHFKRIGLAIAFSPRAEALLAEATRLSGLFGARLTLIHVGTHREENERILSNLISRQHLRREDVDVHWMEGEPSKRILEACRVNGIDLLITGALKKEGLVQHYLGSVARKILRNSGCSVLTIVHPGTHPKPYANIVVDAEEETKSLDTLRCACWLGLKENSQWLHVVREIKMYGLSMSTADQVTEEEYNRIRQDLVEAEVDSVQRMLSKIPHNGLKINIKILSGKSGFEIAQFAKRKRADLLVVSAPPRRLSLLDRLFPHDLEYIFADLPCNLLVVHPQRGPVKKPTHA
jgi:nucleotide-binding universal stress UspA family protein